jgi:hypothetical protein
LAASCCTTSATTILSEINVNHFIPCAVGYTWEESVEIDIEVCLSGDVWWACLKTITGKYSTDSRLAPGKPATEVTGVNPGNSTEANYCDQVSDLLDPYCDMDWDMLQATVEHELVHFSHLLSDLEYFENSIRTAVEALQTPDTGQGAAAAKATIMSSGAMSTIEDDALSSWSGRYGPACGVDHSSGDTTAAERSVYDPMITSICTYAILQSWTTCADCP